MQRVTGGYSVGSHRAESAVRESGPKWTSFRFFAAAALTIAFTGIGCGGISEADRDLGKQRVEEAREALETVAGDTAGVISDANRCERMVSPLVKKLKALDSILNSVGLNYSDYGERVAGLVVAYGNIKPGQLGLDCLNPGGKAERALRAHVNAHGIWQECFEDLYCDNDSINADLQSEWLTASDNVERAGRLLAGLRRKAQQGREAVEQAEQNVAFAEKYLEEIEAGEKSLIEADRKIQDVAGAWAAEQGDDFEGATVERALTDGEDGAIEFSNGEVITLKAKDDGWEVDVHDAGLSFGLYE